MPVSAEDRSGRNFSAAQKLLRLHRLAAGALELEDAHRASAARHCEVIVEHGAGRALALALGRSQNLDAGAVALEPGAGKRREPAAMIVHGAPRPYPVDAGLTLVDLRRDGDSTVQLR